LDEAIVPESVMTLPRTSSESASAPPGEHGAVQQHRTAQLEEFVRRHVGFVWRVARHCGLSHEDADDVTQRVMLTVMQRFEAIQPGRERAYLYRVTRNHVRKANRTRERRREDVIEDFSMRTSPHPELDLLLERRRAHDELCRILACLPEKLREVFVLFEFEGWTQSEMSAALGVAQGTVASRLRRAREAFQTLASHLTTPPSGGRDE
jgi:RNA polymerase sigma-70 factor (ECF subfamily)